MKVFKFGGASVKNSKAVKNIASIVSENVEEELIIVVSAMGKMTNAFEWLINAHCYANEKVKESLNEIVDFHNTILQDLFKDKTSHIYVEINEFFYQIEELLSIKYSGDYDKVYDSFIGYGELLSTKIIAAYLSLKGLENKWLDSRSVIKTDNVFRQGNVNWNLTQNNIIRACRNNRIVISQGFIASNTNNETTSLGREGSDFTAAIFGYSLNAKSVTIWKDVEGMLNADPKYYPEAQKLAKISYHEAIELSYYGASVIHPKTLKPLQNKQIPLYVKSFINPKKEGSIIQKSTDFDTVLPSFIFIKEQILISISPRDFSFIAEGNISAIFNLVSELGIKVNLIQNSALSFSICIKNDARKVTKFINELKKDYKVLFNDNVTLFTIRHYNEQTINEVIGDKTVLLEQRSRNTARFVLEE